MSLSLARQAPLQINHDGDEHNKIAIARLGTWVHSDMCSLSVYQHQHQHVWVRLSENLNALSEN